MIEVITHAECLIKAESELTYEQTITEQLMDLEGEIATDKIVMISTPQLDEASDTLLSDVLATFILMMPEADQHKPLEAYSDEITPFLERRIPNCHAVVSTKVVQIKRIRQQ